jgi:threonine synthase
MLRHEVLGWRCAVCGTQVELTEPQPWRCPRATFTDRHHVLHQIDSPTGGKVAVAVDDPNPFVRFDHRLAWAAAAAARGMTTPARLALVHQLDAAIEDVAGTGFRTTPCERSDVLSAALGLAAPGGVWVKDETGNVAGSHKARHLMSILLHLLALEAGGDLSERRPLAIASCGNAALAAATLARAADWPIDVFVPTWMSDAFGRELDRLGATTYRSERRPGDPPGDPAIHRFRDAVESGAIPFTVQGPENALCLDGGRTIGWEIAETVGTDTGPDRLDVAFAQVGGGAFATALGHGLRDGGATPALHAVQAAGCAPLERAWNRIADRPVGDVDWGESMTLWENPASIADGILDDETYDWLGVVEVMRESGGGPVVVDEETLERAHRLSAEAGFSASATGSAGLAGAIAAQDRLAPDSRVLVVMSGCRR